MTSPNRVILVVGSGSQIFREYILRSVSEKYQLWLLSSHEASWEKPYISGSSVVDTLDVDATVACARSVADAVTVSGVLCYDELSLLAAARAAEALSLPASPAEAITACRDKHVGRRLLAEAGIPQPVSLAVSSLGEAEEAASRIGYPVVIKPRALAGSNGVVRVDKPDELHAHYAVTAQANFGETTRYAERGVLIEEYLTGPEISIDAAYQDGVVTPLAVARKQLGFPPNFEETGHTVDAEDPLLRDATLLSLLSEAHRALGLNHLVTHTEIRLTPNGPRIVEINARLGGDLIPYLARLASGVDAASVAADLCTGTPVTRGSVTPGHAAIRMLYPEQDIEVADVTFDEARLPAEIHTVRSTVNRGARLQLPPRAHASRSRYGYAIAVGTDEGACLKALDAAEQAADVTGTPLR